MTAWLLATDPDATVRNGGKAVALAQRAEKSRRAEIRAVLVALAAATAESGDFTRAAQIIEQANRLPDSPFSDAGMLELQRRFESGKPYRDGMRALLINPDAFAERAK